MPRVTIVSSKLTIQIPKYSAPLPLKLSCSGGRAEAARDGISLPEMFSIDLKFLVLFDRSQGYHSAVSANGIFPTPHVW
jgi:hypothetical protein